MPKAKPFSWVVRFTVAPFWVADGFSLCDDRALSMFAQEVGFRSPEDLKAVVLEGPSPIQIARIQGYGPKHPVGGEIVRELRAGVAKAEYGRIRETLIDTRRLLDSVAFVKTEGDTAGAIAQIDAALRIIDARQGEEMEIGE